MEAQSGESRLSDYWTIFKRRWVTFAVITSICLVAAVVFILASDTTYRSSTLITIQGRTQAFANVDSLDPLNQVSLADPVDDIPSQIEELMSLNVWISAMQALNQPISALSTDETLDPTITPKEVGQTQVIRVDVDSKSKKLAQDMASQLPVTFNEFVRANLNSRLEDGVRFVSGRLQSEKQKLSGLQTQMAAFRKKYSLTDINVDAQARVQQLGLAQADLRTAQREEAATKGTYLALKDARSRLTPTYNNDATQSNDAAVQAQEQKVADLEGQYKLKLATFLPSAPEAKQLEDQITQEKAYLATMKKELSIKQVTANPQIPVYDQKVADAKAAYDAASQSVATDQANIASVQNQVDVVTQQASAFQELQQSIVTEQDVVNRLTQNLQDLQIRQSSAKNPITVIGSPTLAIQVRPAPLFDLFAGLVLGLLISIGVVMVRERNDDRIYSSGIALQTSGMKALGAVPQNNSKVPALISNGAPYGESYRFLRSNVLLRVSGEPMRSITVASATNAEGRSEVAANLATSLAQAGHKVVLVDTNFRNPQIGGLFSAEGAVGLTEVLAGSYPITEVVRKTNTEGLEIVAAGNTSPGSVELLSGDGLAKAIEDLKEQYHFIVLDTAPCLAGADAQNTAAVSDATVFVVRLGYSKRTATRFCVDMLKQTKSNVLGIVFSKRIKKGTGVMDLDLVDLDQVA